MTTFKVEIEREDDGRWLAEVVDLPGVLAYGETQEAGFRLWPSASSRNGWSTVKPGPTCCVSPSKQRERLAEYPIAPGTGGSSEDWLGG